MNNTYPITDAQKTILSRFTCERLKEREKNLFDIMLFRSRKGEGLVANLKNNGWVQDNTGTTAYYIIRNPEGEIVMFFSLKCGVLFDPDYAAAFMERFKEALSDENMVQTWLRAIDGDRRAIRALDRLRNEKSREEFGSLMEGFRIKVDKKQEPNTKIIRVSEARSAIELVEFCANDRTKASWNRCGLGKEHKMGETLFWWFIVPKMLQINDLIGSEYVYLFAADETVTGKLSNYYREVLHFNNMTHLGTIKPSYDFSCFFMGNRLRTLPAGFGTQWNEDQEDLRGLDYYRDEFFANFNQNPDAEDNI
jgi:hypothetical protein